MKKSIFSLVFAFVSFAFTANAQSCCSSKAKDKTTCGKKTATTEKATNTNEANSLLVPKLLTNAEKMKSLSCMETAECVSELLKTP